jgi:hypothetical protein
VFDGDPLLASASMVIKARLSLGFPMALPPDER